MVLVRVLVRAVVAVVSVAAVLLGLTVALGTIALAVDYDIPDPEPLYGPSTVLDRDGVGMFRFAAELERREKPLAEISPFLRDAVIATEDHRFYDHPGVDPLSVMRAVYVNVRLGSLSEGGSTLTQQYVKNVYTGNARTIYRKAREAIIASQLEKNMTKDEILEAYLNRSYFGEGAYGAEAAAFTYFDRPSSQLTLGEAAVLASTLSAPTRSSPFNDPDGALERRNVVLDEMERFGFASASQVAASRSEPLTAIPRDQGQPAAPFIIEEARRQLLDAYGPDLLYRGGLTITLALDLDQQFELERRVMDHLPEDPDLGIGVAVVDPASGDVRAAYSGRDFATSQVDLALGGGSGGRQSGSTFKPVVLATALEEGYTLDSVLPAPSTVDLNGYRVSGGGCGGACTLRQATTSSINTVFAQLGEKVGLEDFTDMARRLGMRADFSLADGGLSYALGTEEVTPLDMASAYATFANDGVACPARVIMEVRNPDGTLRGDVPNPRQPSADELARWRQRLVDQGYDLGEEDLGRCYRAVAPSVARTITAALEGVVEEGTGTRADIGRPQAGKTGTSQRSKDLWYVGYTPDLSAAVFYGYIPREIPLRGFGGTVAAPIWANVMAALLAPYPPRGFPEEIPVDRTGVPAERATPSPTPRAARSAAPGPRASATPSPSEEPGASEPALGIPDPDAPPSEDAEPGDQPLEPPTDRPTEYDGPPVQPTDRPQGPGQQQTGAPGPGDEG